MRPVTARPAEPVKLQTPVPPSYLRLSVSVSGPRIRSSLLTAMPYLLIVVSWSAEV